MGSEGSVGVPSVASGAGRVGEGGVVAVNGCQDRDGQGHAWTGGLIGILAGVGATLGLLVAGGEGLALGASFGAAAGWWPLQCWE